MSLVVEQLIADKVIKNELLVEAFRAINRQDFVRPEDKFEAEANAPLSIGCGQTISQPFTVAMMLEWLDPQPGERVLDVGSGSGWQTALLAQVVSRKPGGQVVAIERVPELKEFGEKNVAKYNYVSSGLARCVLGDGGFGYPASAPYNRIVVAAAAAHVPPPLLDQLAVGGRLVMPLGDDWSQTIVVVDKIGEKQYKEERHPGFIFVPLITKAE